MYSEALGIIAITISINQKLQEQQVIDVLREVLNTKPNYKERYFFKDYLQSNLGKVTVLGHFVNRPSHVKRTVQSYEEELSTSFSFSVGDACRK